MADDGSARYPYRVVTRYENVTNSLSREFYLSHGAEQIEPALELQPTAGERVMISSYCIRCEIGECLKQNPTLKGNLYIEHSTARYMLGFDCQRCLMTLTDCSEKKK
jgi:putative protease